MTRKERINQEAAAFAVAEKEKHQWFNISSLAKGFAEGAEWADEHPDLYTVTRKSIAMEREYLVEKATEWLTAHVTEEKYHPERGFWNIGRFLDDFKKYMEEQQ